MSKPRSVLAAFLVLGLLAAAAPPATAAAVTAPVCRTATGLLGGVTGLVGGMLGPLGLSRAVQPDCDASAASSAVAPVVGTVNGLVQTLAVTCWRAAAPVAQLGLTEVYVAAARACSSTSIAAHSGIWATLYGACAQAGSLLGAQGMSACFQAISVVKAIHDRALGSIPRLV